MSQVVVLFHSGYGHTERVAQAVAQGANAQLIAIDADGNLSADQWAQLDASQAIIFGSPTYMGTVSWQFKKIADASSKQWMAKTWQNKVAGGFTVSANLCGDKMATLQTLVTLAMQQGMIWVGQNEANSEFKYLDGVNRLGSSLGVMAQCGPTDSAKAIPQGDIDTAIAYGKRIAQITAQLND